MVKSRAPKKRSDRPLDPARALRSALRAKPRPRPARLLELAIAALDRDPALAFETACAIVARRPSERERRRAHGLALEAHARANELGAAEEWFRIALDASAIGAGHTLEKAAEIARRRAGARGPRRIRVHARVLLARGAYARSAFERSRRLTEDALAIANGGEPDLEVTAHMGLAILASNDLSSDAVRHARRALLVAERAADPLLLARAKAQLGICLAERGLAAEGRAALLVSRPKVGPRCSTRSRSERPTPPATPSAARRPISRCWSSTRGGRCTRSGASPARASSRPHADSGTRRR
jgi:hypothetical protein